MSFKYMLNEWPPVKQTMAFALQWLLLTVPLMIILGRVVASVFHPHDAELQLVYLQKLFFVSGVVFLIQLLAGHKLPIITGPASVLLVGILANAAIVAPEAIYSSIAAGGAAVAALAVSGRLAGVSRWFTKRIIGIVLMLIAFTMLPTIINLLAGGTDVSFGQLVFAGSLLIVMLSAQRFLPDFWRSTMLVWALVVGGAVYCLLFGTNAAVMTTRTAFFAQPWFFPTHFTFVIEPAVLISFLFCFLALVANDIGSTQTTAQLIATPDSGERTRIGLLITGLGNVLAGIFGVIGPVSFSLSTGVILSSRCASRYTLLPAAAGLIIMAFIPWLIQALAMIPAPVIGTLLLYMMFSQLAGGFAILKDTFANYKLEAGFVVGAPLLIGVLIAFLPGTAVANIPPLLRPLLANGFVAGVVVALLLEHIIFRER